MKLYDPEDYEYDYDNKTINFSAELTVDEIKALGKIYGENPKAFTSLTALSQSLSAVDVYNRIENQELYIIHPNGEKTRLPMTGTEEFSKISLMMESSGFQSAYLGAMSAK